MANKEKKTVKKETSVKEEEIKEKEGDASASQEVPESENQTKKEEPVGQKNQQETATPAKTVSEEEYTGLYEKYLRLLAEFDNFKKRSAREKSELYAASKSDVITALLPVIDNLDRAMECPEGEELKKGVELILKQFSETLGKLGIKEIEAEGLEFNPEYHYAVFHEDKEGEPENTVAQVVQKGYMLEDKVIRHAMVKVIN